VNKREQLKRHRELLKTQEEMLEPYRRQLGEPVFNSVLQVARIVAVMENRMERNVVAPEAEEALSQLFAALKPLVDAMPPGWSGFVPHAKGDRGRVDE
jgi:hypothetical protein